MKVTLEILYLNMKFSKFPYLDIQYIVTPVVAANDLRGLLPKLVIDQHSAARVLQILVDQGRKTGLQIFLTIEHPESALPEVHRLTTAILTLSQQDNIYCTPPAFNYSAGKLYSLFGVSLD